MQKKKKKKKKAKKGHVTRKPVFVFFFDQIRLKQASAFRKLLSIYVFNYFPSGFEGRMWDLIVSVPDHCLSLFLIKVRLSVLLCAVKTVEGDFRICWTTSPNVG